MKTKLLSTLSVAVLMGIMSTVNAADFHYKYVEGTYQDIDSDGLDGEAFNISGSYDISPKFNIIADYTNGDIINPAGGSDLDFEQAAIGMGYHTDISPTTDFIANVKIVDQNHDLLGDDTGYGVGVGVRHKLTDKIEVGSNVDYVDVNDIGDTSLTLNSRYYLNDKASLGLSYATSSEDNDVISAGVRFNF